PEGPGRRPAGPAVRGAVHGPRHNALAGGRGRGEPVRPGADPGARGWVVSGGVWRAGSKGHRGDGDLSVRRKTTNRLTLYRTCGTCGGTIVTTADTPWVRQVHRDGKRQATTYYCSESCWRASYKHPGWWDGMTQERRKEREASRDTHEKNRRYYAAHAEQERKRARDRYWSDPHRARADNAYQRRKRKALSNG